MSGEKAYKTMKRAGVSSIVIGIVTLVIGVTAGILLFIQGGRLLKNKSNIMF